MLLMMVSITLFLNLQYILFNPFLYNENQLIIENEVLDDFDIIGLENEFNHVKFINFPIRSNNIVIITLNTLNKIEVEHKVEFTITKDDYIFNFDTSEFRLLKKGKVDELTITLNDKIMDYYEKNGYYNINSFNISGKNRIHTLKFSYKIDRKVANSEFLNRPLIFNEKYASIINLPLFTIPMEANKTSLYNNIILTNYLNYQTISKKNSGWMGRYYLNEIYEILEVKQDEIFETYRIWFPIMQKIYVNNNVFKYVSNFTSLNNPSRLSLTIIPNNTPLIFIYSLLVSPFYIPFALKYLIDENEDIKKYFIKLFLIYIGFIINMLTFLVSKKNFLSLLNYCYDIIDGKFFVLLLLYPLITYFVYYKYSNPKKSV